jgi:hypothetical protein
VVDLACVDYNPRRLGLTEQALSCVHMHMGFFGVPQTEKRHVSLRLKLSYHT